MDRPSNDNIVTIEEHAQPSVMVPIASQRTAVVVQMPSRWDRAEQPAAMIITMPTRIDCAETYNDWKAQKPLRHLPSAVRLTLLALFAWLGWSRPTHGKDPGAAGARPWKPAFVRLVSVLHLPKPSLIPRPAAAVVNLPAYRGADFDSLSAVHVHAA